VSSAKVSPASGRIVEVTTPDYSQFFSVEHEGTTENLCVTMA